MIAEEALQAHDVVPSEGLVEGGGTQRAAVTLLEEDGLLVECRDHDVLHAVDVGLLYLLEDVGDVGEQDGLAAGPALLEDLQLLRDNCYLYCEERFPELLSSADYLLKLGTNLCGNIISFVTYLLSPFSVTVS